MSSACTESRAICHPATTGAGFGDFRGVGQIHDFAAVTGNCEDVVNFSAAVIRFENDPFAVGRPGRAGLAIVGLAELDRPSAGSAYFPEVVAPCEIGSEDDFFSVRRQAPPLIERV